MFEQKCMCCFVRDTVEHRTVIVASNVSLPEKQCSRITNHGSTRGMSRVAQLSLLKAMLQLVTPQTGTAIQNCYQSIDRTLGVPRHTRLTSVQPRLDRLQESETMLTDTVTAFPTDAKAREKATRKK